MSVLKKRSFFEIDKDLIEFFDRIEEAGGEITDEQEIELNGLQMEVREKMMNVAYVAKEMEMSIDSLKNMKKEISASIKIKENAIDRLKKWFKKRSREDGIIRQGSDGKWEGDKIESSQLSVSWRRSKSVSVNEDVEGFEKIENTFPHFYKWTIIPSSVKTAKIINMLIDNGEVELKGKEISKTSIKEHYEKGGLPISGLEFNNNINPQFKL